MPGSLTSGFLGSRWGVNIPSIPGACTSRNFTYLVRGPLYGIFRISTPFAEDHYDPVSSSFLTMRGLRDIINCTALRMFWNIIHIKYPRGHCNTKTPSYHYIYSHDKDYTDSQQTLWWKSLYVGKLCLNWNRNHHEAHSLPRTMNQICNFLY